MSGIKTVVTQDYFYRIAQFFSNVVILVGTYGILAGHNDSIIIDILHLASPLLMTWSMLYFVQVLPIIGYFVISMQRMLKSMLLFLFTLVLALVPFMQAFSLYAASHSQKQCIEGFGTVPEAFYTLFSIMLNTSDFSHIHLKNPIGLWILHVSFVFGVPILMLNFLIADMSDKVTTVTRNKHTITTIQQVSMFLAVEGRLGRLFARYYDWVKAKYFVCDGKKLYLAILDQSEYFEQ